MSLRDNHDFVTFRRNLFIVYFPFVYIIDAQNIQSVV